jgi:hypothetical protein
MLRSVQVLDRNFVYQERDPREILYNSAIRRKSQKERKRELKYEKKGEEDGIEPFEQHQSEWE